MLKRITAVRLRMTRFLATLGITNAFYKYSGENRRKKREEQEIKKEEMTGKVSGSQVPGSPEGEKQGWPVKVVRAGVGGSGFLWVFKDVGREEKTVRREEG